MINNVVIVSGEQQRDSAIQIHSPPNSPLIQAYSSIICNRYNLQKSKCSTEKWMDKQIVVCLYKEILVREKRTELLITQEH